MKTISSFINESNKTDFLASVKITLESGLTLESSFVVRESNKSIALTEAKKTLDNNSFKYEIVSLNPII